MSEEIPSTSYPIRTTHRSLRSWFAAEPARFTRERSPKRTIFWAIVSLIGLVLTVVVLLDPAAVTENFAGRRRAGAAVLGAFVLPPALIVCGIVFQFLWIHRFRIRDGGLIGRGELFIVPHQLDVRDAFRAFAVGSTDPDRVREAMRFLDSHKANAEAQTGNKIVALSASPDDRTTFAGVLVMDPRRKGVLWINQEPLTISGEHYFDPRALRPSS